MPLSNHPLFTPITASVVILAVFFLFNFGIAKFLRRSNLNRPSGVLLGKLVAARNVLVVLAGTALLAVWVKELASFFLSVAAVAGAMLIVSKELITCWLGSVVRTIARPFAIGDVIEVGQWTGKVVDSDLLTTSLLEMGRAHQFTGNRVEVPNSVFLSQSVKNLSVTGQYFLNFLTLPVPASSDVVKASDVVLKASLPIVSAYQEEAEQHLKRFEAEHVIDLPSVQTKVLIEPVDSRTTHVILRFACPAEKRVTVEQQLLQSIYAALHNAQLLASPKD
jgi:small-conductance mechanosensitive channel